MKRDANAPKFVSVRAVSIAPTILWQLLEERPPEANISHAAMPSADEHLDFVTHHPYRAWYLIRVRGEWVGAAYITRYFEIGIAILKERQGMGYGKWAVREMERRWARHLINRPTFTRKALLANVAPGNTRSQKFFESLGYKLAHYVYVLDV